MRSIIIKRLFAKNAIVLFTLFLCLPFSLEAKQIISKDSDGDGLSDQYELKIGTEAYLSDTDGDGIADGIEVGDNLDNPLNTDADKRINALDSDDDDDGLPTVLESQVDTDKDGIIDYLDSDSDNDGVPDGIEAGMLYEDQNRNLIDDAFDTTVEGAIDKNGDGINDVLTLPDHNHDGIPDYLDNTYLNKVNKYSDSKAKESKVSSEKEPESSSNEDLVNKVIIDAKKAVSKKEDAKIIPQHTEKAKKDIAKKPPKIEINRLTDTDNDGLLDKQELSLGTNPLKRDSDGDLVSDAIEIGLDINAPQDSDHDGIIDALDEDDDNDGVLTKLEDINKDGSPINDDTDDDGVPNFLDANDDGDSKLTLEEGGMKDTDKDGVLDYLDKNDGVKDSAQRITKKEDVPDKPEIVDISEGEKKIEITITKPSNGVVNNKAETLDENISDVVINKVKIKTVEKVEQPEAEKQETMTKVLKVTDSIPPVKEKSKSGLITWLTSLLPD